MRSRLPQDAAHELKRIDADRASDIDEFEHIHTMLLRLHFPDETARALQLRGECPLDEQYEQLKSIIAGLGGKLAEPLS